ncbi:DUF3833 family protein [Sphingomonas sp. UV9]|uniref:DUF3833 family protein n=1 Tax=Sphingomonas sp. UV9 TaxID=1851410 RepID=UPI000FFBAB6A|nr:DUF3833 family protein [Sphingomonas sp. UV9]RXD07059.1 DUF3833 family protein [Sphingomonas sp. UV9]
MPSSRLTPIAATALALLLAACAGGPPVPVTTTPPFVAERFFAGRLDGVGTLKIILHGPTTTHVASIGTVAPDGTLILDQHIEQPGKPARDRQWRIRPLGNGRYTGSLTDASGPVTGETSGNRLHLAFPMKGGLRVDQWLTLSTDAQVAQNHMIVRKLGVTVARLDETIRKVA